MLEDVGPLETEAMSSPFRYTPRLHMLTYALQIQESVAGTPAAAPHEPRRWMRGAFELCVQNVYRTNKLLNNYVANYKLVDPQWKPLLDLPCGNPVGLELRARHVNVALRHFVQKGHALYTITDSHHSVVHPRGLAERSFVITSMGIRGERLQCTLIHEGPVDAANPHGDRGVVAMSTSNGMAHPFDRRTMLVERTRRIGSIQASMGAFDWTLIDPSDVGVTSTEEVLLLRNATRVLGGAVQSAGIVSSAQIAAHPYHYVTEFEAPSTVVADINRQLAFYAAREQQMFDAARGEELHCMAYSTKGSIPRSVPLEVDLPFKAQISAPVVGPAEEVNVTGSCGDPFCIGSVMRMDSEVFQGSPEYLYDPGPVHRPIKWWQQRDCIVSQTVAFYVRDGKLPTLRFRELLSNPFLQKHQQSTQQTRSWKSVKDEGIDQTTAEASSNNGAASSSCETTERPPQGRPLLETTPRVAQRIARSNAAAARVRGVLMRPRKIG